MLQDVDEALKRLPQDEVDARNQRLKRAMDLSLKHEYLPNDLQTRQTPWLSYVQVKFFVCCLHETLVHYDCALHWQRRVAILGCVPLY